MELHGEDGRLLARQVRVYDRLPWDVIDLTSDLDFEILPESELGRLVISLEDEHGRIMDLNSLDLILLSKGRAKLAPASSLQQAIIIQQPAANSLVTGGVVLVSGLARPGSDQPLRVALIAEDGRVLGQRLAGVEPGAPGEYRAFSAEVPYFVSQAVPVMLAVYEEGGYISNLLHLTSIEIIISP